MRHLDKLQLTEGNKKPKTTIERRREKLVAGLREQQALAKAMLNKETYTATRRVRVKGENGQLQTVERRKLVKQWYWRADDGSVLLAVRFGTRTLELAKGMEAVVLQTEAELPAALEALVSAVQNGELDEQLTPFDRTSTNRSADETKNDKDNARRRKRQPPA